MTGAKIVMPTNCKTWACVSCRDRLKALFQARVEAGCSALGQCAFITLTYRYVTRKDGSNSIRNVYSVRRDWRVLLKRLQRTPWMKALQWLRVIEVTKAGQPHLHLVMGPIPGNVQLRCWRKDRYEARMFIKRKGTCLCFAHTLSSMWERITQDSWIVDARYVLGGRHAAAYLAKYLFKGALVRERLELLGFTRRWSSSRGWPGNGRMRLLASTKKQWDRVDFYPGLHPTKTLVDQVIERYSSERLLERVGNNFVEAVMVKRRARGAIAWMKGQLNDDQDVRKTSVTKSEHGGDRHFARGNHLTGGLKA